jgi:hypothetical protein
MNFSHQLQGGNFWLLSIVACPFTIGTEVERFLAMKPTLNLNNLQPQANF